MMNFLSIRLLFFTLAITLFFSSCSKQEKEVYEDYIVSDNPVPSYKGVSSLQIRNYINKLKVDLLGDPPTEAEFETWMGQLIEAELSDSIRLSMVRNFTSDPRYFDRFFEWNSANMLESLDYNALDEQINTIDYVIDLQYQNGDTLEGQLLKISLDKLQLLRDAAADLEQEDIDIRGFYTRMINNSFYDEINMGTENFVIATFENLAGRLPTAYELASSKNIVDGDLGILFLETGNNKDDFMNIFMNSDAFRQGVIQLQYDFLLARPANAVELEELMPLLASQQNILPIQEYILTSDEYAGFE